MGNLVAVIISIGLTVFMAGAAINYGGSIYGSGAAKAQAAAFISSAEQIESAWTLWEGDSNLTVAGGAPTAANLLANNSQGYSLMITWPQPLMQAVKWNGGMAVGVVAPGFQLENVATAKMVFIVLSQAAAPSTGALGTCTQISQMSGMVAAGATLGAAPVNGITLTNVGGAAATVLADVVALSANYKFGCFQIGGVANGAAFGTGANAFTAGDVGDFVAFFRHT